MAARHVTDAGGGVIPGATVIVRNMATGIESEATTTAAGAFNVPALSAGTYSLTVSLAGFKTVVINDIRLVTASPATVQVKLEVGELTETVEVTGGSTLVQTTSTAVTSTIAVEQLQELPLVSRNALYSVAFLPGVETAGGPRGAVISQRVTSTLAVGPALARVANELANSYKVTFARPGSVRMEDLQVGVMFEGVTLRATAAPFGTR